MKNYRARRIVCIFVVATSLSAFGGTAGAAGAFENQTIGVVGCSNTKQHIEGYTSASDLDQFWDPTGLELSGGTLRSWATDLTDQNSYWANFSQNIGQYGVDAVWIQLCMRDSEASSTGMTPAQQNELKDVVAEVERRAGAVPIYVSPLNAFVDNDCRITGPFGVSNAVLLANWAAATGLALRGPDTGPLDHSQLLSDLCHLGPAGINLVGKQLVDFFDIGGEAPISDFTYSPLRPRVDEDVLFRDLSTDDGKIVAWSWSFGNGVVVRNVQNPRIQYRQAGTYEVILTITDDDHNKTATTQIVTVGHGATSR